MRYVTLILINEYNSNKSRQNRRRILRLYYVVIWKYSLNFGVDCQNKNYISAKCNIYASIVYKHNSW